MADQSTESRMLVVSREPSALRPLWAVGEANCWQMETAASGWEALDRVQSGTGPDLVLLDNRLGYPIDGWGILQELRFNDATVRIPIILYSGDHDFLRQKQAFIRGMGANVLYKPFDLNTLFQTIDTILD